MENFTQGNDPRQNGEKPETTWQKFEQEANILTVYRGANDLSGVYYKGAPEGYFNGAVKNPAKPLDFVGDDSTGQEKPEEVTETAEAPATPEATEDDKVATEEEKTAPESVVAPENAPDVAPATTEEPIDPTLQ